jgi:hypothetical protein
LRRNADARGCFNRSGFRRYKPRLSLCSIAKRCNSDVPAENADTFGPRLKVDFQNDGAAEIEQRRSLSWSSLSLGHNARKDERNAMAGQTDQLHAMIAALAGSQALLLDVLRRRGSIAQDDIDYILTVTEQGIAKAVGSAGPQAVVQMIRLCLQQLSTSE